MANKLQGDRNGQITIPNARATGNFLIHIPYLYISDGTLPEICMGHSSNSQNFILVANDRQLSVRVSGSTSGFVELTPDTIIDLKVRRTDGANVVVLVNDVVGVTLATAAAFSLDRIFSYNGGIFQSRCGIQGTIRMEGFDAVGNGVVETRQYNCDGEGTTLVDTLAGQNGTLSGFTTGGFVVDPNPPSSTETLIEITSPTSNSKAKRRNPTTNQATFTLSGTVSNINPNTIIEYSYDNLIWSTLDATPAVSGTDATWSGNVVVTGRQTIYTRLNENGAPTSSTSIDLAAVFSILVWGQSNAEGNLTNYQSPSIDVGATTPLMLRSNATFTNLADTTSYSGVAGGSIWPLVIANMANANPDICYCLVNVAQGNTSINAWLKDGTAYSGGTLYDRIDTANTIVGGFELCWSIIGESDSSANMPTAEVELKYGQMTDDLFADYGVQHRVVYFPSLKYAGGPAFRTGIDNLIANNPNAIFGGDLRTVGITDGDNIHLQTDAHAIAAAQIVYDAINSSVLSLTVEGIPDGDYQAVLQSVADYGSILFAGLLTFSGETTSRSLPVTAGTIVTGYMDGDGTDNTGALVRGVTI